MYSNNSNNTNDATEFVIEPIQVNGNTNVQVPIQQSVVIEQQLLRSWYNKRCFVKACDINVESVKSKSGKSDNKNVKYYARKNQGYIIAYDTQVAGNVTKNFKIANNYEEYVNFLSKIGDQHLYECFWEDTPLKFYMDIEKIFDDDDELDGKIQNCIENTNKIVEHFTNCLTREFSVTIIAVQQDSSGGFIEVKRSTDERPAIETRKYKYSKHLIFNGVVFQDMTHVTAFFYKFIDQGGAEFKTFVANKFIDNTVYGTDDEHLFQQMRSIGQTKLHTDRVLRKDPSTTIEQNIIVSNDDNLKTFTDSDNIKVYCERINANIDQYKSKEPRRRKTKRVVDDDDANDNESVISKRSKTQVNVSNQPDIVEETHVMNELQHSFLKDMLKTIDPSVYEYNKRFYALARMLHHCEFTYDEYNECVLTPYLDYIRVYENRESKRAGKYGEDWYNNLSDDDNDDDRQHEYSNEKQSYSKIIAYCKKHLGLVVNDTNMARFNSYYSNVSNWYHHCKRQFEEINFCRNSLLYYITEDPVSHKPVDEAVEFKVFREMYKSWVFFDPKPRFFADYYSTDPLRKIVDNLFWKPLRNGEVGGKIFETDDIDKNRRKITYRNYNTWSGFYYDNFEYEETEQNQKYIEVHKRVIKNLSGHPNNAEHEALINYQHMEIAAMIQRPDELPKVATYCSSTAKGVGKGIKGDFTIKLLTSNDFTIDGYGNSARRSYGVKYIGSELKDGDKGCFGTFNSTRLKRLFVHISEYEAGLVSVETFRSAITDETIIGVEKFKGGVVQDNYAHFYVDGQDTILDLVDDGDRRWCLTNGHSTMKDEKIDGEDFWEFVGRMYDDKSFLIYLFHWYKNYPLPEVLNWKNMIPNTLTRTNQVSSDAARIRFAKYLNEHIRQVCIDFKNREKSESVKRKKNGAIDDEENKYKITCMETTLIYDFVPSRHNFSEHAQEGDIYFLLSSFKQFFKSFYIEQDLKLAKDPQLQLTEAIMDLVQRENVKALLILGDKMKGCNHSFNGGSNCLSIKLNTHLLNKAILDRN